MRTAGVFVLLAACSFEPGRLPSLASDDASIDAVDADPDAMFDAAPDAAPPAPFALDGETWLLPCTPGTNGNPNSRACRCANDVMQMSQIAGGAGQRWRVTVRIYGVMERMGYIGGNAMGAWYVGGSPGDAGNNVYRLTISSPSSHYFINHGSTAQNYSTIHDYMATFDIDGGATVTFFADGQDGIQWEGVDMNDVPITLPGVTNPMQPYNGQFAILSVVDAVPL